MAKSAEVPATSSIRAAEFFAGIGLVRQALEPLGVSVVWSNDIERAKRDAYAANHDANDFHLGDVRDVTAAQLPVGIELATSSFPCVDLSLAGNRRGLVGLQSGMFWEFARVIDELGADRPKVLLLENVQGFATSHGGKDVADALRRLSDLGYSSDVIAVDARHFVPQSRPRMFIIAVRGALPPGSLVGVPPVSSVRAAWVQRVHAANQGKVAMHFFPLPDLPEGPADLAGIVQKLARDDARWWDAARLNAFLSSLSPVQAARLADLRHCDGTLWRTAYRRTRDGIAVWEVRRDAIGGCLRTTGGGSSKQALVELQNGELRVRWMTALEYARMMGADSYNLRSGTANQAMFGFGDAVVVDVVRWIGKHYLFPALRPQLAAKAA